MPQEHDTIDELPEALVEALREADRRMPLVTARVDREVLAMARQQFSGRQAGRRRGPAWAAVAAAILLAVIVGEFRFGDGTAPAVIPRQPDIADVLKLARERAGDPAAQAEIDALAMRVVALAPRGARP